MLSARQTAAHSTLRILSDFDGVWTDQKGEAAAIQAAFAHEVAGLLSIDQAQALDTFLRFHERLLEEPEQHGWWPRGYLTAFVDEDDLLATGAVGRWLDNDPDLPEAEDWRRAIQDGGHARAEDLVNESFGPAMKAYREESGHSLVPEAKAVAEGLASQGHELVIVSNSPPEKLHAMFSAAGLEEGPHLRLIGDARKWWIDGPEPRQIFNGRPVHLNRPLYRDLLKREQPDVVIGDVASLDLAVPADMRANSELSHGLQLFLMGHARSSTWATEQTALPIGTRLADAVVPTLMALLTL